MQVFYSALWKHVGFHDYLEPMTSLIKFLFHHFQLVQEVFT